MLFPTAAQATHTTHSPYIEWPIARAAIDHGTNTDVVLVGRAWGVRRVARYIDSRVNGLKIHYASSCEAYTHSTCIIVKKMYDPTVGWSGQTTPWVEPRVILINTYWPVGPYRQHVSGHELMHALGMTHHSARGLCSAPATWKYNYPTLAEIRALRREFR